MLIAQTSCAAHCSCPCSEALASPVARLSSFALHEDTWHPQMDRKRAGITSAPRRHSSDAHARDFRSPPPPVRRRCSSPAPVKQRHGSPAPVRERGQRSDSAAPQRRGSRATSPAPVRERAGKSHDLSMGLVHRGPSDWPRSCLCEKYPWIQKFHGQAGAVAAASMQTKKTSRGKAARPTTDQLVKVLRIWHGGNSKPTSGPASRPRPSPSSRRGARG